MLFFSNMEMSCWFQILGERAFTHKVAQGSSEALYIAVVIVTDSIWVRNNAHRSYSNLGQGNRYENGQSDEWIGGCLIMSHP